MRLPGELVPRTDELTIIATINTVTHQWTEFYWNNAFELDCQIRDAFSCIDQFIPDNRPRRTGIDTPSTLATMRRDCLIDRQRQINQHFSNEKKGASIPVYQKIVFSLPAQAGFTGKCNFHDRSGIGKYPITE